MLRLSISVFTILVCLLQQVEAKPTSFTIDTRVQTEVFESNFLNVSFETHLYAQNVGLVQNFQQDLAKHFHFENMVSLTLWRLSNNRKLQDYNHFKRITYPPDNPHNLIF